MKKLKILALFCCGVFSLTSFTASKDPISKSTLFKEQLVGKWQARSFGQKIIVDDKVLVDDLNSETTNGVEIIYEFKNDNSVDNFIHSPSQIRNGEPALKESATYNYSEDSLIIKYGEKESKFKILLFDKDNLHIQTYNKGNKKGEVVESIILMRLVRI